MMMIIQITTTTVSKRAKLGEGEPFLNPKP